MRDGRFHQTSLPAPIRVSALSAVLAGQVLAGAPGSSSSSPATYPSGYSTPESPAAAIAGASTTLTQTDTPAAAGTDIISAFNGNTVGVGPSVSFAPNQWVNSRSNDITKPLEMTDGDRLLDALSISAAWVNGIKNGTTASGSDSTASNLAIGLYDSWTQDDPKFDAARRDEIFANENDPKKRAELLKADQEKIPWSIAFGSALNSTSTTNQFSDVKYDGGEEWLTGSYRVSDLVQLLSGASYRFHQYLVTKGVGSHQSLTNLGLEVRAGQNTNKWDAYAQIAEKWTAPQGKSTTGTPVYTVGGEYKLPFLNGTWIQLGWSNNNSLGGHTLLGSVHYAWGPKSANSGS